MSTGPPSDAALIRLGRHLDEALGRMGVGTPVQAGDHELLIALAGAYAEPLDRVAETIDDFLVAHQLGVMITLSSLASERDGQRLLRPEILLVLERLVADPFALQRAWPASRALDELHILADSFARPL